MLLPAVLAVLSAKAHVPFFDEHVIQRGINISQAYYFTRPAILYPDNELPDNTLVEVVSRDRDPKCRVQVHCDTNVSTYLMSNAGEATGEPFTQSAYRRVMRAVMTCQHSFYIDGECYTPWAAVVGKEETFTAGDMVWRIPPAIARIHGAWWNEMPIGEELIIVGYLTILTVLVTRRHPASLRDVVIVIVALISTAWFVARLYHAILFAENKMGAAVGISFVELVPLTAAYLLWRYPRHMPTTGLATVLAIGSLFLFGAGMVWGPFLLLGVIIYDISHAARGAFQTSHAYSDTTIIALVPI